MPCPRCPGHGASSATSFSQRRGGLRAGLGDMSRAAVAAGRARLRDAGLLPVATDPRPRLAACAACPLRTLADGVAYCGRPLWQRDVLAGRREPGCGCPLADKARDPAEHCPLAAEGLPVSGERCTCRWCAAVAAG